MDSKLFIYRPVKTNHLNQKFGDNTPCAQLNEWENPIRPFVIRVNKQNGVCPPGWTDFYTVIGLNGHNGEDWACYHGEPLYFPVDCPHAGGWIARDAADVDGGIGVDVISKKPIVLDGQESHIKFRFWHLKSTWKDAHVDFGELIGYCDNTGASSGDHLHWAMKRCTADGEALDKDNGYYGAVDFSKWFENEFVLDVVGVKAKALTAIQLARKVIMEIKQTLK